jgi:hypothetical protein
MQEQRYSASDRRKDFMIDHYESDLRRPEIEPGSPNSQSNPLTSKVVRFHRCTLTKNSEKSFITSVPLKSVFISKPVDIVKLNIVQDNVMIMC